MGWRGVLRGWLPVLVLRVPPGSICQSSIRQLLQACRVCEQPGTCGSSGVGEGCTLRRQFSPLPRGSPLGQ